MRDVSSLNASNVDKPDLELIGEITEDRAINFLQQLKEIEDRPDPLIISVMTVGGDAEMARRIILELTRLRNRSNRRLVFVGKTQCYSAGVSIMSCFPIADRFLTEDCWLLIHCRQLEKTATISGPVRHSLPYIEALAAQIRLGMQLEDQMFQCLIEGSTIGFDEICNKAPSNWYLTAEDALERGLIAGIV